MEKERKVGVACLVSVTVFVVAWMPFAVLMLVGNIVPHVVLSSPQSSDPTQFSSTSLTAAFAKISAACNGIIYGFCFPKRRSVFVIL